MKTINTTLSFNGEAEAAFNLYRSVFGGEFIHLQRMSDIPGVQGLSAEEANKVLHVALQAGNSILNGMDIPGSRTPAIFGTNIFIGIETSSEEETDRFMAGLAEGGQIMMPAAHQFWGSYFGMVTDRFGVQWMVGYAKES